MTESTETVPVPQAAPAPAPRPFASLKVDPQKVADGVWVKHPDTEDQLCVRRLWCAQHLRAIEQAAIDYEAKHGTGTAQTAEGNKHCEAVGLATGVITNWRLASDPTRPYDPAVMAAILVEPGFDDLKPWVMLEASKRGNFRPAALAGN